MRSAHELRERGEGLPDELRCAKHAVCAADDGFMLIALVVAIFLILLSLSVAAPRVARSLRREREVETMRRAGQYTRALQLYYKKVGRYPGSMEQLEKTNNIRFLRHKYVDPLTGKDDWRLIHIGEQKTTVKGFFGKPLTGIANTGLGSATGLASQGGVGTPAGAAGNSGGGSSGFGGLGGAAAGAGATGASGSATAADPTAASGAAGTGSAFGGATTPSGGVGGAGGLGAGGLGAGGLGSSGPGGLGSASGSGLPGGGAPFLGIGVPREGDSILTVNEQTTYATWEFLYDPRVEQLKARVNLLGGGVSSTGAGSLGSAGGLSSGFSGAPGQSGAGTPGASSPSSFGSSSPGGFGSSSPPGGTTPTPPPTTPPQP